MSMIPWTTFAAAAVGDDLHSVLVSGSLFGVRSKAGPVLRSFLSMDDGERTRALAGVPARARVVLVAPSSCCALRPMALTIDRWESARPELVRHIESLFPLASSDAMVGLVEKAGAEGGAGYLVAADRSRVEPWMKALERALSRRVDAVVSSHMALAGLGLQSAAMAEVLERSASGSLVVHRLQHGEVVELSAPFDAAASGEGARAAFPGAEVAGIAPLSGSDLALGAAMAERIAPGSFAPLSGRAARSPRRWVPTAAAIVGAAVVLWGAGEVGRWRYEAAIARLDAQADTQRGALDEARRARDETQNLVRLATAAAAQSPATVAGVVGVTPGLLALQRVLPDGAFLYRVELNEGSVIVRGEAKRAGDVLRAIEDAPEFQGAREVDTPVTVEERGLEMFHIRAERLPALKVTEEPTK